MSIAIGIHTGRYVIVGTDVRGSWYGADGRLTRHTDGYIKLHETSMGLLVGTGDCGLLDAVVTRSRAAQPDNTTAMLDIIAEARRDAEADPTRPPHAKDFLQRTAWMLTYRTVVEGEPTLRLALYHPDFGHGLTLCQVGAGAVAVPDPSPGEAEARRDLRESYLPSQLEAGIRICGPDDSLDDSLAYHTALIASLIATCAARLQSISPAYQIGVHDLASEDVFVSGIVQPGNAEAPLFAVA